MGSSNCTVVGQRYNNNSYSNSSAYAGANSTNYYTYSMQFTTPNFTGVSKKLTLNMYIRMQTEYYTDVNIRYALLTSDANISSYMDVVGAVTDSNQIVSGVYPTMHLTSTYTYYTLELDLKTLAPNTTYYLVLWGSGDNKRNSLLRVGESTYHVITIECDDGLIYIDTSSGLEACQCYFDNGTGWDLYLPYVDTDTGWDQCV